MIIPFAFVMNIGMNNLSLKYTTLALNQLIRSFSPVAIALTSYLIEGKVQSVPKAISLSLLVSGVVMGVWGSPDFTLVGFLICAASLFGQSLGIVMTAFMMGGASVKLHVFDVLLYSTLPSTFVLLPWSYAMGEFEVLEKTVAADGLSFFMGLIFAGGALAFTYNLFCTVFVKMTSSVYYGVTGGFRCSIAILVSFFVFPQKVTTIGICGIVIAMASFIANSYFTLKEQIAAKKAAAKYSIVDTEKQALLSEDAETPEVVMSKAKLLQG
eukprot:CAMPEP_0184487400 /NCGR_PEP_ID=MMETSP0113_2-20130426/10001_1 /TAXON_ID=91329 /ORGANISM="Norrisiella sphaerica, Strain BC52" /LENGTH=268 /DNA_ID=CAMNT_0026869703 /DNA_START=402 /DNA_END=1208 /DNA_ORIENTATION=+